MKSKKKNRYDAVYTKGAHKDAKAAPEIELLGSRALLAIRNFTHYTPDDYAVQNMRRLFKDFRNQKDKVKEALLKAFTFLKEESAQPLSEEKERFAKQEINKIAREIWK